MKIIVTKLTSSRVRRLALRGPKRLRAKYRHACVLTSDGDALMYTCGGMAVVARLLVGWFTLRLETADGRQHVDSGRHAIQILRRSNFSPVRWSS